MIGKTRQTQSAEVEELFDPEVGQARGMLRRTLAAGKMRHARRRPASDLAPWIAHYWIIHWDLRGCPPYIAESVPHPNVHLIFEHDGAAEKSAVIAGVQIRKFHRVLEGEGHVFGVKFRAGGFRPFYSAPISTLANRTIPARRVFGNDLQALEAIAFAPAQEKEGTEKENDKVAAANEFFHARMPEADPNVARAGELVERILSEPEIRTVDDLSRRTGTSARSLQRLFGEYVGASPKWVIRRYRLHELIEKFNSGATLNWAQLALDLGYFDQAHLINDFKKIVGLSPVEYRKIISASSK
ncbi:MAG: helix-turn-helix domain-containing protein [Terriglobales bacterium]